MFSRPAKWLGELATIGRLPRAGLSSDQIKQLAQPRSKVDAVITGVVSEYGPVRSGSASANVVSVSVQMIEKSSGVVVWSASSTQGRNDRVVDRLFGGGGATHEYGHRKGGQ